MKNLIILLISISMFSQDYGNDSEALKLCSVLQTNQFGTDVEAENALDKILNAIGASKRFVLQPCSNINNAVATSYKGIRYILYDRDFMNSLSYGNNWGNLFVLAHEVGHHINGHSLDLVLYAADAVGEQTLAQSRQDELEADEFAGFILAKLGGPLSAAIQSITTISSNRDDTYSTHPNREKRLAAVRKGFNKANNSGIAYSSSNQAEEFFYKGVDAEKSNNMYEAFGFYTKSIQLNPSYIDAYNQRAILQYDLFDNINMAIDDISKAIELSPQDSYLYYNRSIFYNLKNEPQLEYQDLNTSIKLNPNNTEALQSRGILLLKFEHAVDAISDFDKVIFLEKNNSEAYLSRALAKTYIEGKRNEACEDARISLSLGNVESQGFLDVFCK